jgi:16S rRNA (uracil1498-N3)-methyltransferase
MATRGDGRGAGPERAFVAQLPAEGQVTLDVEESRHLLRARRVQVGDTVVLFDGRGQGRFAELLSGDGRSATLLVGSPAPGREPARAVRIACSLPEAGKADDLVAMLAELGVAQLQPIVCARTDPARAALPERRARRWARLNREAAKVSGCNRFLVVCASETLAAFLTASSTEDVLLLDPDPAAPSLVDVLPVEGTLPWLVVGPEGGFTDAELAQARDAGHQTVRLGTCALRTGTAATSAAAIATARA